MRSDPSVWRLNGVTPRGGQRVLSSPHPEFRAALSCRKINDAALAL